MKAMDNYVVDTARWIAAARARETQRADRLFDDPYAAALAGDAGVAMLARSEAASGGENLFLPVRTRYFDDVILSAVAARQPWQMVLLGAGLDTRAYRLPLPADAQVYELDQADLLAYKAHTLAGLGAQPRCGLQRVGVDLNGPWASALLAAGFQAALPSVWIAEGLLFYLSEATVRALLRQARELAAPASLFVADVFGGGLLRQSGLQSYLSWLKTAGRPLPFCTDQPADLFAACGWPACTLTSPGAADANYGRWRTHRPHLAHQYPSDDRAYFIKAGTAP